MSKRATRRAPHMEKYISVKESEFAIGNWFVDFVVDNQTFRLHESDEKESAYFMMDMFAIALDAVVKQENKK